LWFAVDELSCSNFFFNSSISWVNFYLSSSNPLVYSYLWFSASCFNFAISACNSSTYFLCSVSNFFDDSPKVEISFLRCSFSSWALWYFSYNSLVWSFAEEFISLNFSSNFVILSWLSYNYFFNLSFCFFKSSISASYSPILLKFSMALFYNKSSSFFVLSICSFNFEISSFKFLTLFSPSECSF
jgi:hypothetical protein